MSEILLDTNVFIDFLRGHREALRFLEEQKRQSRVLCSVAVAFELYAGCRNASERERVRKTLLSFTLIPIEAADSLLALEWFQQWNLSHGVEMLDCLIGAAAHRLSIPLYTRDQGHFSLFESIDLRNPY